MKLAIVAAAASALVMTVAAPASAAVVLSFGPGGSSPLSGLTVFEDFETGGGSITSGANYLI